MEANQQPFPHFVIDGFAPRDMAQFAVSELPPAAYLGWVRYDNPHEKKRTLNDPDKMPASWRILLRWLNSPETIQRISFLTGVAPLCADPTAWGAGIHVTEEGGYLAPHIDFAICPTIPLLQRRVNVILHLSEDWRQEWGGATELWDDMAKEVKARVYPAFNRALIWEATDLSYHSGQTVQGAERPRVTAAAYYLGYPVQSMATRKRALFVPQRA